MSNITGTSALEGTVVDNITGNGPRLIRYI